MIASITHNWHTFAIYHIPSRMGDDQGEGWNGGELPLVPYQKKKAEAFGFKLISGVRPVPNT